MEEVIRQIIDIEEQAQKIIDDALEDKRRKEEEHVAQVNELEDQLMQDAHRKVAQIREREFKEIREQQRKMQEKCKNRQEAMEKRAAQEMDKWVDNLVNRVLDKR